MGSGTKTFDEEGMGGEGEDAQEEGEGEGGAGAVDGPYWIACIFCAVLVRVDAGVDVRSMTVGIAQLANLRDV